MKRKYLTAVFLTLLIVMVGFRSSHVFAEDNDTTYEKGSETQGGIALKSAEYPLETYQGVADVSGDWIPIDKAIVGISNGLFGITKLIYSGVDEGVNTLSSKEIIADQSKKVTDVSKTLWDGLSSSYGITFLAIAFIVAFYLLAIKFDVRNAFYAMFKATMVFILAFVWLAKADVMITTFDSMANAMQGIILSAGGVFQSDYKDVPEGEETQATVAILRNTLFKATVYRPYLMMNYGTVDEQSITKDDSERIDKLSEIKKNSKGERKLKELVEKEEIKDKNNNFMDKAGSGVYNKLAVAIVSLFVVIGVGIPFLMIALSNLLIQFFILGVVLLLPFAFLFSLLPRYSNSCFSLLEKLVSLFLTKAFISLFVLFMILVISVVDSTVNLNNTGGVMDNPTGKYVLNSVLLIVVLNALLAKRSQVISLVTGGQIKTDDGSSGAKRGLASIALTGAGMYKAGKQATRTLKRGLSSAQKSSMARHASSAVSNKLSPKRYLNSSANGKNNLSSQRQMPQNGEDSQPTGRTSTYSQSTTPKRPLSPKRNLGNQQADTPTQSRPNVSNQATANPTRRYPLSPKRYLKQPYPNPTPVNSQQPPPRRTLSKRQVNRFRGQKIATPPLKRATLKTSQSSKNNDS